MKNLIVEFFRKLKKINSIAVSIGFIYLWFGILKFFPEVSPAEELAKNTIEKITFGLLPLNVAYLILAIWETSIGLMLIGGFFKRFAIVVALIHLFFTFTPLILFPETSFQNLPFSFTIVGQYIVKNVVIVCALFMLLKQTRPKIHHVTGT